MVVEAVTVVMPQICLISIRSTSSETAILRQLLRHWDMGIHVAQSWSIKTVRIFSYETEEPLIVAF